MKQPVLLHIRGSQKYENQEPEIIELTAVGTLEAREGGWVISYEESELTGLAGVTSAFQVEPGKVTLSRTGALNSQMVFQEGLVHDSLYELPFGALMLSVNATHVSFDIAENGGTIDLHYDISIENTQAGVIEYHLDIQAK